MENIILNFSLRLKEIRKLKKLSQKDIAKIADVSQPNIARYENLKTEATITPLAKIALSLGVSTDYLLGIDNNLRYSAKQQEAIKTILILNDANLDKIIERAKTLKELE